MVFFGLCQGVLLVAQPKSGSTSLMETLGSIAGVDAKQELSNKLGTVQTYHCGRNDTLRAEMLRGLVGESLRNGSRILGANFSAVDHCNWTAWESTRWHVHAQKSCFRLLPHSDMWELHHQTVSHWLTSRTLYKQHVLPTPHNLDLVAKTNGKIALLVRDPVDSAIAYHFAHPTQAPLDACRTFGLALALARWRQMWLTVAAMNPKRFFIIHFEDLYASSSDRLCRTIDRVLKHLGYKPKHDIRDRQHACTLQMAQRRYSQKVAD